MPGALAALVLLLMTACAPPLVVSPPTGTPAPLPAPAATPKPPPAQAPPPGPATAEESGQASWYGAQHHGRRTASGEIYDMHDLTAAHRTLPFGTRVLVTNVETGQSLEVRINDRGPFVDGRILDLSHAAAVVLGAMAPGVIPVRLRIIPEPSSAAGGSRADAAPVGFTVQLGSFTTRRSAERLRERLSREADEASVDAIVVAGQTQYRVRVGTYADRAAAQAAARQLAERGYHPLVVERGSAR